MAGRSNVIKQRVACRKGTNALLWTVGALIVFTMIPAAPMFVEFWIFGIAFWVMIAGFRRYGLYSLVVFVIAVNLYEKIVGIVEFLTALVGVLTLVVALIKTADFVRHYPKPIVVSSIPLVAPWQLSYSKRPAGSRLCTFVVSVLLIDLCAATVLYAMTFLARWLTAHLPVAVVAVYWLIAGLSIIDLIGSVVHMVLRHSGRIRNPAAWMLIAVTGVVVLLTYCLLVLSVDVRASWATKSTAFLEAIAKWMSASICGIVVF